MESTKPTDATIDPREQAFYDALAATWWDESGPFWPLHRLNRLRARWIADRLAPDRLAVGDDAPLAGLEILDIGCGGGLLSEAMARLGARVTGIDVTAKNIAVAKRHAAASGLAIEYRAEPASVLVAEERSFDVVLNMEVIEHVANVHAFMRDACALVRPGGVQFVATINRNPIAWLVAIVGAEYVLGWLPRGTHQYAKLVKPREAVALLRAGGLTVTDRTGVFVNPVTRTLHTVPAETVNYMLLARRSVRADRAVRRAA